MFGLIGTFAAKSEFMPHGYCFAWDSKLLWLHIGSDILTGIAYFMIAGVMTYFLLVKRDTPFLKVFILFALFIFACGSTHFMSAWTIYVPSFWAHGEMKAFNAIISFATAIVLVPVMPRVIALPSLQKTLDKNTMLNKALHHKVSDLQDEIIKRKEAEELLNNLNEELEGRVKNRTIELEDAIEELRGLDRLKSMFIASMSHELRTPLNSIIGFTGILLKGMTGELNEEQIRQLSIVKGSSSQLLSLINDIIDVSKIETDSVDLFIEELDIVAQLEEIKESFAMIVNEKGIAFSIDAPDALLVTSDERRVRQIIMNLVSNVFKFAESGEVKIKACKNDDTVEVSVYDTGIGIREEDVKKLFQPFSRIAQKDKLVDGSGLGLYLSQKLAILLGGEIRVESEFGKGSVFTLSLPLRYKEILS